MTGRRHLLLPTTGCCCHQCGHTDTNTYNPPTTAIFFHETKMNVIQNSPQSRNGIIYPTPYFPSGGSPPHAPQPMHLLLVDPEYRFLIGTLQSSTFFLFIIILQALRLTTWPSLGPKLLNSYKGSSAAHGCFWFECKPANPVLSLCQPAPCVQGCAQARACHSGQSWSAGSGASVEEGSPARCALSPSQPPSPSACSPPSLP